MKQHTHPISHINLLKPYLVKLQNHARLVAETLPKAEATITALEAQTADLRRRIDRLEQNKCC